MPSHVEIDNMGIGYLHVKLNFKIKFDGLVNPLLLTYRNKYIQARREFILANIIRR
jgi:hypothetical protein